LDVKTILRDLRTTFAKYDS